MRRALPLLILALVYAAAAQAAPDPMEIMRRATTLHKGIKDYTAKVSVDTDMPNVDIPHREAKVYVKPPDKTYVEAKGLVVIPKRALMFGGITEDIEKNARGTLIGTKVTNGQTIYCIKFIPRTPEGRKTDAQPSIKVWVNGNRWTVEKVSVMDGSDLIADVAFTYQQVQGFWMPAKVSCTVPKGIVGSSKPGQMSITFSEYKINTGLTDKFFEDKEKAQRRAGHRGHPKPREKK